MMNKMLPRKLKFGQHEPHMKTGGELRCLGSLISSCSTSRAHHVIFFLENLVLIDERGKGEIVITSNMTIGTYALSFEIQITANRNHLFSSPFFLLAPLNQENNDMNH